MRKSITLFLLLCLVHSAFSQSKFTISGFVKEKGSKEQLIGVNVYQSGASIGTTTNTYGFYSITLSAQEKITIVYSYVGYEKITMDFVLNKNIEQNIELKATNTLKEVIVSALSNENKVSENVQMSKIEIPINQIKKIPTLLGEKDVLKVLQLMPGVQKGSEGQSGIYVRGGGPDQNLIILDDAIVYNANHLFGFFSTFNGDALKSVELTKGGFPARFGGRLSSVIEMNMKDGNKEKIHGEGGFGLISSRLLIEGPIKFNKNKPTKSSFIVSGRRTYIDALSKPFIAASQKGELDKTNGGYYFYDFNAKFNYEISEKDKIYLSGYFGSDDFSVKNKSANSESDAGINWGNNTGTFRWNHLYSQKLFSNSSLIFSQYNFNIFAEESSKNSVTNVTTNFKLDFLSGIRDFSLKHDFDYFPNQHHAIKFGFQTIFHHFTPSATILKDSERKLSENTSDPIDTIESGIYIEDVWQPVPNLKFNAGLRLSHYKTNSNSYIRPEPRLAMSLKLSKDVAIKASFAQMNQYLHLLSNTGLGLPTDLWVPATEKIAPQQSDQFAVGLAKDFDKQGLSLTIEGYFKNMRNIINYKEGASFLQLDSPENTSNNDWQDQVVSGNGTSYGLEILLQKKVGRFSGWTGYTLSKTLWTFPELNLGESFFPRYDRRHDISLVGIYELTKRITLSSTWVYGTGNALTIPKSEFHSPYTDLGRFTNSTQSQVLVQGLTANEFGQRNSFRAEAYHRMDFGIQFHKQKKRFERTWDFSVYNLYNRRNPFFYTVGSNQSNSILGSSTQKVGQEKLVLKRYSLFPIIPSFSYNIKF